MSRLDWLVARCQRGRETYSAWFRSVALLLVVALAVGVNSGSGVLVSGADDPPLPQGPRQRWGSAKGRSHLEGAARNRTVPKTMRARHPLLPAKHNAQPPRNEASVGAAPVAEPKVSGFEATKSTELLGERTANGRVFANPDGTQTTEVSPRPINFRRPDGSWTPIDTRLVPVGAGQGWRNAADSVDVRLAPRTDSAPVVRMALDAGHEIAYSLQGAAPVSGKAGERGVSYPAVLPDTDLKVDVGYGGVKETIALRSAKAATSFTFPLELKGLTPSSRDGQVVFLDETGRTRAAVPAGFMTDSAATPATSTGVTYSLVSEGGRPALRVDVDAGWVRDPARKFPVLVDPSVEVAAAGSSLSVNDSGSTGGGQDLTIGSRSAAYLAFPQLEERLKFHRIFGANLWMVNYDSATCRSRPVTVHPVTQAWVGQSGLKFPGPSVGGSLVSKSFSHGYIAFGATRSNCPTSAATFNLGVAGRNLVQRWANGTQPNYGLSVRDASSDGSGYKKFTGDNTANPPRLIVTHSPYNASYTITDPVPNPPVTQAQSGRVKITVTNTGAQTWTPAGFYLAYRVYDKKGKLVTQQRSASLPANVARGAKVRLDATIKPLKPDTYFIDFTMVRTGGPVFIDEQVRPIRLIIKIIDIPPVIQELYPRNGYQTPTLSPQLWATAIDLDPPPGSALTYKYEVCEKTASGGTTGCFNSGFLPTHAWTVPAGKLWWSKTYQWRVTVKDTGSEVPSPWVTLLTAVPQPEITSRLAGSSGEAFNAQVGNYSTTAVDASVAGVGPELSVERTYNSLDPRRDLAFGAGWTTVFDMRIVEDKDGSGNVVVTYPDGQQVRYGKNPDGTFAPPPGRQATLTVDTSSRWKLADKAGSTFEFSGGRLIKITDATTQAMTLTYDPNSGRLSKVGAPGGRFLSFVWSTATPPHLTSVSTNPVDGRTLTWTYTYTGDLLTKVCGPAGRCTTYTYGAGSHYRSAVQDSRPSSYYRLSEDEGISAGSQVAVNLGKDAGTYKNVTLNAAGGIVGTDNAAASFNGTTSNVMLPPGTVKKSRDVAVEVWFKPLSTGGGGPLIGYQDKPLDGTPTLGVPMLYLDADARLRGQFWSGGAISPMVSNLSVNDGKWHHAVLSAMGSTQTLYLDGKVAGTLTGQTPNPVTLTHNQIGAAYATTPASWPRWGTTSRRSFSGTIDEVAIYDHPLGDGSVAAHYREGVRAADQITQVTLPSGKTAAEIDYDTAWDRVSEYTDGNGGTWKIKPPTVYGGDEDLRAAIEVRDPGDRPYLYEYDALAGRMIRLGKPTGIGVREEDLPGSPTPSPSPTPTYVCTSPDPGDPSFCTTLPNKPGDAPDFIGHYLDGMAISTFEYDDRGFLSVSTNETGEKVKLAHDARGNVTTHTQCRAKDVCQTAYYTYPAVTNPADPRNDKPIEFRDGRSTGPTDNRFKTGYTYTTNGNLASVTYPEGGGQLKYTYTDGAEGAVGGGTMPSGQLLTETDQRNAVTRYAYTSTGDLAEITEPTGLVTKYGTDGIGRIKSATEISDSVPGGAVTGYGYDDWSNLTSVTAPQTTNAVTGAQQQQRVDYSHDADGNLIKTEVSNTAPGTVARSETYDYDEHNRVERVTDAEGHETGYDYDRFGNLTAMVDAADNRYEYAYTARNMIAEVRLRDFDGDPEGTPSTGDYLVVNSRAYDHAGRLTRDTDAMGHDVFFAYYADGRLKSTTLRDFRNPDGTKRDYVLSALEYDGAGNLTKEVTDNGKTTSQYTIDKVGRIEAAATDPTGLNRRTALQYDQGGNVTKVSRSGQPSNVGWFLPTTAETVDYTYDPAGRLAREAVTDGTTTLATSYTYDQRDLMTSVTSPRGNVEGADKPAFTATMSYDELGRQTKSIAPPVPVEGAGTVRPETVTGYNVFDEVTEAKDPLGKIRRTEYDRLGQPVKQVAPAYTPPGSSTPITPDTVVHFDPVGNVSKIVDPRGNETRFSYDRLSRLKTRDTPGKDNADRAKTQYTYTRTGEPLSQTGPTGARTEATYDDLGRQVTDTQIERHPNPTTLTTRLGYDDANLLSVASPSGAATTHTYDSSHELTKTTDPSGVQTQYGYDNIGRQIRTSDGLGRTARSDYNQFGRLVAQSDLKADGTQLRKTLFGYDADGNQTELTNPLGHKTTLSHDALSRLTKQIEPVTDTSSITTTYGYDAAGNRTRFTDGRGNATTYTVNSLGLPESVIEPSTTAHPNPVDRTWTATYDAGSNPVKLTAPGGVSRQRTFDAAGRLTKETGTAAEASTSDRIYDYDAADRLTKVNSIAGTNTYTYNDRGLLLTADGPAGNANLAYNADGQLTTRTDSAGTSTYTYLKGRLDTIRDGITATTQTLGYDPTGAPNKVDYGAGRIRTLGYDDLGRLDTDTLKNNTGAVVASTDYGYNDNSQTTSKTTTGVAGAGTNTYGYDQAGRLTTWTGNGATTDYTWDAAGNRTKAGNKSATFDERNRRLTDGTDTFTYTPRGTTAAKTTSGATQTFSFDAFDRIIASGPVTYAYDSLDRVATRNGTTFTYTGQSDEPNSDGTATYARGPADQPLATQQGTSKSLTLTDKHGDLTGTFNPDTTLTGLSSSTTYDPFGQPTATNGTKPNIGYQGDWTDPSTNQVNMGARWYTPTTGGFTSRDSWNLDPTPSSVTANRYTYANANPSDHTDPTGHDPHNCMVIKPKWMCDEPDGGGGSGGGGGSSSCGGSDRGSILSLSYADDCCRGGGGGGGSVLSVAMSAGDSCTEGFEPGRPPGGGGGDIGSPGRQGPSQEEIERERKRRRTKAAKEREERKAKRNPRAIPKNPSYAKPSDNISRGPQKPATQTQRTRNVVRDTEQSLWNMRNAAIKKAGPPVHPIALHETPICPWGGGGCVDPGSSGPTQPQPAPGPTAGSPEPESPTPSPGCTPSGSDYPVVVCPPGLIKGGCTSTLKCLLGYGIIGLGAAVALAPLIAAAGPEAAALGPGLWRSRKFWQRWLRKPPGERGAEIGRRIKDLPRGSGKPDRLAEAVTRLGLSHDDAVAAAISASEAAFGEVGGTAPAVGGGTVILPKIVTQDIVIIVRPNGSVIVGRGNIMNFIAR